jgi:multicomponent Na+:H+ antiporter subunit E
MIGRSAALALLWWLLAGSDPSSWWVGAPAVATVAWVAARGAPGGARFSPAGAARFAVFFLRGAVAGGVDVAARALRPSLPIAPLFVEFALTRATSPAARVLFVAALGLMPGTLAARLDGERVRLHALDPRLATPAALAALEAHVAAVFAESGS